MPETDLDSVLAESDSVVPQESSRMSALEVVEVVAFEFELQSVLLPTEILEKYKSSHSHLKKELALISLGCHVLFEYVECL